MNYHDSTYTYAGTPKSTTITGTLPTGTAVAYDNNTGTNAGVYAATAWIDGGVNYYNDTLNAILTINKIAITGITFLPKTYTYDGTTKERY